MDTTLIITSLASGFIGTFLGAALLIAYNEIKKKKIRKIAISALKLFMKYANTNKTYKVVEDDFNNTFNLSEKRAILVLLHKLGIPIATPLLGSFNINQITFMSEKIDKATLINMQQQIDSGNCDEQFFLECEVYFNSEILIKTQRNIALRYIDEVMVKTTLGTEYKHVIYPEDCFKDYSPREMNLITVFRIKNLDSWYYNSQKSIDLERVERLRKEVNIGLWDEFLKWDSDSYDNLNAQKKLASLFTTIAQSAPFINQIMQGNPKEIEDKN